jgi:hypothetical protein
MRRPAVRRRLQAELAALPQPALSYEELLAFFIDFGVIKATDLLLKYGRAEAYSADTRTADRLAAELLPQLCRRLAMACQQHD